MEVEVDSTSSHLGKRNLNNPLVLASRVGVIPHSRGRRALVEDPVTRTARKGRVGIILVDSECNVFSVIDRKRLHGQDDRILVQFKLSIELLRDVEGLGINSVVTSNTSRRIRGGIILLSFRSDNL
jgi:hypothetical protein